MGHCKTAAPHAEKETFKVKYLIKKHIIAHTMRLAYIRT